jgi:hypothetical protein
VNAHAAQQGNGADRPQSAVLEGLDPPAADQGELHGGGRRTRLGCNTGGRQLIADPLARMKEPCSGNLSGPIPFPYSISSSAQLPWRRPVHTKETVRALLDRLPDDCTMDDVLYHLYVVQAVEQGRAELHADHLIEHDQVVAQLRRKWLLGAE